MSICVRLPVTKSCIVEAYSEPSSGTLRLKAPFSPTKNMYFVFVGKFVDRSLPPTPPPEKVNPQSHSIWDSDTAKVSLLPATSNNNNKNSLSPMSLKEGLKTQPWYKSCDRKKAEQMLLKCKYIYIVFKYFCIIKR